VERQDYQMRTDFACVGGAADAEIHEGGHEGHRAEHESEHEPAGGHAPKPEPDEQGFDLVPAAMSTRHRERGHHRTEGARDDERGRRDG
jgi:hypothetical protein